MQLLHIYRILLSGVWWYKSSVCSIPRRCFEFCFLPSGCSICCYSWRLVYDNPNHRTDKLWEMEGGNALSYDICISSTWYSCSELHLEKWLSACNGNCTNVKLLEEITVKGIKIIACHFASSTKKFFKASVFLNCNIKACCIKNSCNNHADDGKYDGKFCFGT